MRYKEMERQLAEVSEQIVLSETERNYIELGLRLAHNLEWNHGVAAQNNRDFVQAQKFDDLCSEINALYKKLFNCSLVVEK